MATPALTGSICSARVSVATVLGVPVLRGKPDSTWATYLVSSMLSDEASPELVLELAARTIRRMA